MARNSTNDRNATTIRNLDYAAQARELTEAELDSVSGGTDQPAAHVSTATIRCRKAGGEQEVFAILG